MNFTLKSCIGDLVKLHHADFGITDERGRAVGFMYRIDLVEAIESNGPYWPRITSAGDWYQVESNTTRNGDRYGALTPMAWFKSREDAEREADRRVEVARKRYTKKYGKQS
jgi:hypothetical protein